MITIFYFLGFVSSAVFITRWAAYHIHWADTEGDRLWSAGIGFIGAIFWPISLFVIFLMWLITPKGR